VISGNRLAVKRRAVVSQSALESMRATVRDLDIRRRTQVSTDDIARQLNPLLRGWIEYYGRYMPSALGPLLRYVNQTLQAWVMRKFKSFWGHKTRARHFLMRLAGDAEGNEVRQVFVSSGLSDAFAENAPTDPDQRTTRSRDAVWPPASRHQPWQDH
jgi:hypothetical protein